MLNKTFIVSIFVFFSLLGCAASGTNDNSSSSARASSTSPNAQKVCNAGEILHCASRSPHRISDGRYGRNNNKSKKCMCVPEGDLQSLERSVITGPQ